MESAESFFAFSWEAADIGFGSNALTGQPLVVIHAWFMQQTAD
jgi:hypothetical protein